MAYKLYTSTMEIVLGIEPADENSWSRVYSSLSCLRLSLLCCVCDKLLVVPHRPVESDCEHIYCKACTKRRKTSCETCAKSSVFEEHLSLRISLQCYKSMCRYILASGICRCWDETKLTSPMARFVSMVYEGADLCDKYHYEICKPMKNATVTSTSDNGNSQSAVQTVTITSSEGEVANLRLPKDVAEKAAKGENTLTVYRLPDPTSDDSDIDCPKELEKYIRSIKKKSSCRCGRASQHPGNLTCCGQRCPCYVNGRSCINCRCRGCRNPQKNIISSPPYHSDHQYFHKSLETTLVNKPSCSSDIPVGMPSCSSDEPADKSVCLSGDLVSEHLCLSDNLMSEAGCSYGILVNEPECSYDMFMNDPGCSFDIPMNEPELPYDELNNEPGCSFDKYVNEEGCLFGQVPFVDLESDSSQ